MSIIRILSDEVSNRIAAGEVVERPASIVKELIENSLDAQATQIAVHVSRGGRSLIRVVDNGCGMDQEDALLCLEAHATSKIRTAHDIEKIMSFGFRGEALPSIASVSHLELRTRQPESEVGTEVLVDGGVIKNVEEVGCAPGTSITVKTIFYNLPARRKFLRNISTEESHIQEGVLLAALANPNAGFQLTFDNRPILAVQTNNDIRTRATMLLGKDTVSSMLAIDYAEEDIHISGFIARPGFSRTSRREQRMFVNGRPIEANPIYFAIRDAYHTLVMKGRYPPTLIFLELSPELLDVNVHPAKREVRFHNPNMISRVVGNGIRRALRGVVAIPTFSVGPVVRKGGKSVPSAAPEYAAKAVQTDLISSDGTALPVPDFQVSSPRQIRTPIHPIRDETTPEPSLSDQQPTFEDQADVGGATDSPKITGPSVSAADKQSLSQLRVLGAISDLFLVAEGGEGVVLIDQHAAHERVLFEKVLKEMAEKDGTRQGLLIPVTIDFSNADAKILKGKLQYLLKLGFEIEHFGGNTFIVNAVPAHFPQQNITGMLLDILDELRDAPLGTKRMDEAKIAKIACKAAVKARDHLSQSEITRLLEELAKTELPYTCPHGRPTMINISFKELEKRFGRRQ